MNNKKILKVISILLVLIWMITVFWFSHQVGDESSSMSGNTLRKIITFFNKNIDIYELDRLVELFQPVIRKFAHYAMYTVGGFLIYNAVNLYKKETKINVLISFVIGAWYAITDEIHQLFVPGRSGRFFDVGVDSLGVISGILVYILLIKIVNKIIKGKK